MNTIRRLSSTDTDSLPPIMRGNARAIEGITAYLDRVHLYFPVLDNSFFGVTLPIGPVTWLMDTCHALGHPVYPGQIRLESYPYDLKIRGVKNISHRDSVAIHLHQPSIPFLVRLHERVNKLFHSVCYAEFAIDHLFARQEQANIFHDTFKKSVIFKGLQGASEDYHATSYYGYTPGFDAGGRPPVYFSSYADKSYRFNESYACCHLEARVSNTEIFRKQNITNLLDLVNFNASQIWSQYLQVYNVQNKLFKKRLGRLASYPGYQEYIEATEIDDGHPIKLQRFHKLVLASTDTPSQQAWYRMLRTIRAPTPTFYI